MSLTPRHTRRDCLRRGVVAAGVLAIGPALWGCSTQGSPRAADPMAARGLRSNIPALAGTLREVAVDNDPQTRMRLPAGFRVRQVAHTGQPALAGGSYAWHGSPDGGATFATDDGGWIYVSNSEMGERGKGGVGALRFAADGTLVDSYPICSGTTNNCAGGPTPWNTWLTCEEMEDGLVYECDPSGRREATARPALGRFKHEAAAVDPQRGVVYLTEDIEDGNFYRFVPARRDASGRPDLTEGQLQVLVADGEDPLRTRPVRWETVGNPLPRIDAADPARRETPTRHQVGGATRFDGGEGCWYHEGIVYFTTKGDNRVWAVDCAGDTLDLIYDKATQQAFNPGIDDVDNLTVSAGGDVIVAEDGEEMRLVVVGPEITPFELVNVVGQRGSEIAGPAFSPNGERLYFSSQYGVAGDHTDGRIYEVRGPFFAPV
jgi:secreted PhoX family phosphatase